MKNYSKLGLALLLFALAVGCKQREADAATESAQVTDSTSVAVISSSAAVEKPKSKRKFVRTADLKFKVKSVTKSTYAIENIVSRNGGFVTFTDLKSNINEKSETQVSQDSVLETTRFTVDNTVTIRVPNTQLDTVLKSMAKEIDFLDSRLIKADEVSLQMLSNQLAQKRLSKHQKRLENDIDSKGKKLKEINEAENNVLDKETESDATIINNLNLEDQVNFSTITLYLYQREAFKREFFANEKNINSYRPNIGLQILESVKTGWYILEKIISFIVVLWPFALIGFLGFLGYKKMMKK